MILTPNPCPLQPLVRGCSDQGPGCAPSSPELITAMARVLLLNLLPMLCLISSPPRNPQHTSPSLPSSSTFSGLSRTAQAPASLLPPISFLITLFRLGLSLGEAEKRPRTERHQRPESNLPATFTSKMRSHASTAQVGEGGQKPGLIPRSCWPFRVVTQVPLFQMQTLTHGKSVFIQVRDWGTSSFMKGN